GSSCGASMAGMTNSPSAIKLILILILLISAKNGFAQTAKPDHSANLFPLTEGFIDAHGVMIYYKTLGRGAPLLIVHGGPGASHDYFLPYLLPLARHNPIVFIDERGSGHSEKLEDPSGYTVENMVEDVEAVRQALNLVRFLCSDIPME